MKDFFKYLTPGEEDKAWGIYVNAAGRSDIPGGTASYPSIRHPSEYYFTWERGRTLNEFQINYITRGNGVYEIRNGKYQVRPGSLLITRPMVWHRYRPDRRQGWTENYVGFDGSIPRELFSQNRTWSQKPVLMIGSSEDIIDTYQKIFGIVREEKPGFQQIASGMIMKLMGHMVSLEKQRNFSGKRIERIIRDACFEIRENVDGKMDFRLFSEKNNIGYSYFRKMFKQYTGVPPVTYHLDLKIRRAREMLVSSERSVKEVSYELGFQSIHYFSRLFKKKTGQPPSGLRNRL